MRDLLFLEERRRAILDVLGSEGRVTVRQLSETMKVSEVTIRQDLRALEEQGLLERTYGGAVCKGGVPSLKELSFNVRLTKMRKQKEAIAKVAASLIQDGYSLALDCSTTVYALVPYLKKFSKLTLVTNGLMLAQSFLDNDEHRVLLAGGRLRRDSISVVGQPESLPDINLNIGFFSSRGLAAGIGASEIDPDETLIKQAMLARCVHPVLLIDGSKWGQIAPYTFMADARIEHIITTEDAPRDLLDHYRGLGAHIDIASAPAG
jgi:DeoR/GlpR family transcriptional regulator of sugar metabolism